MTYNYRTKGVCSKEMHIELNDDHTIKSVEVIGGCNGNLQETRTMILMMIWKYMIFSGMTATVELHAGRDLIPQRNIRFVYIGTEAQWAPHIRQRMITTTSVVPSQKVEVIHLR